MEKDPTNPFAESTDTINPFSSDDPEEIANNNRNEKAITMTQCQSNKGQQQTPTWDSIAAKLISEKYLLTALELHAELVEAGHENPRLVSFFSNPANFDLTSLPAVATGTALSSAANISRSCSQTTLDSIEWGLGGSEEGAGEDKQLLLEFELRKARETIQALRNALTQSTAVPARPEASVSQAHPNPDSNVAVWSGLGMVGSQLQPLQRATINFLVGEYLNSQGYRMAAITFAEELENEEFENWDDVGLNMPRPPILAKLVCEPQSVYANPTRTEQTPTNKTPQQQKYPASEADEDATPRIAKPSSQDESSAELSELKAIVAELRVKCAAQENELKRLRLFTSTPAPTPLSTPRKPELVVDSRGQPIPQTKNELKDALQDEYIPDSIEDMLEDAAEDTAATVVVPIPQPILDDSNAKPGFSFAETTEFDIGVVKLPEIFDESVGDITSSNIAINSPLNEIKSVSVEQLVKNYTKLLVGTLRELFQPEGNITCHATVMACSLCHCLMPMDTHANTLSVKENVCSTQQQLWVLSNSTVGSNSQIMPVMLTTLRNVASNVLLSKREEVLPLIMACIMQCTDQRQHQELLNLLLLINKRPDTLQRCCITTALLFLLLPPSSRYTSFKLSSVVECCVKLLSSKYSEQRILGAQCTLVAVMKWVVDSSGPSSNSGSTPEECLSVVIEALICAVSDDRNKDQPEVLELLFNALALILCLPVSVNTLENICNTFIYCIQAGSWEPNVRASNANRASVRCHLDIAKVSHVEVLQHNGLILVHLALCHRYLIDGNIKDFIDLFRMRIESITCSHCDIRDGNNTALGHVLLKNHDHKNEVSALVSVIDKCLPYLLGDMIISAQSLKSYEAAEAESIPSDIRWMVKRLEKIIALGEVEEKYSRLRSILSQEWFKSWPSFDYLTKKLLPSLVFALVHFEASDNSVVQSYVDLFNDWWQCLGEAAANTHLSPLFHNILTVEDNDLRLVKEGGTCLTRAPIVVFTVTVLGLQYNARLSTPASNHAKDQPSNSLDCQPSEVSSLQEFLTRHISIICLCGGSLSAISYSISFLLTNLPQTQAAILSVLWACLVNKSTTVRSATSELWTLVAGVIKDETVLSTRILPGLVTMATDSEVSVRARAIKPLLVVANTNSTTEMAQEMIMKCSVQLETMLEDSQLAEHSVLQESLALAIATTATVVNESTLDVVLYKLLLPRFSWVICSRPPTSPFSGSMVSVCTAAYTSLLQLSPPHHIVAHFIMPPLQQLLPQAGEYTSDVANLVTECNTVLQQPQPQKQPKTPVAAVNSSVEDVRNRVSKIFNSGSKQLGERTGFQHLFKKK